MYAKGILIFTICCCLFLNGSAQQNTAVQNAESHSLELFNAAKWKELISYGRAQIASGADFSLLRMRMGYAAFMLGNYSLSLQQYQTVFQEDAENLTALYYVYLNNLYLNNMPAARYYGAMLPPEKREQESREKFRCSSVSSEFSAKFPDNAYRGNAQYFRAGLNLQLGYRLELQQSGATFNQTISETALTGVLNNRNIAIRQKEYYGKLLFAATGKTTLIGGFHYLNTSFNNLNYNNTVVFGGIKYASSFVELKAMASFGNLADSTYNQFDGTVTVYPLGNTKLYSITRAAYGNNFVLSQIAGYGLTKKIWLEGNVTLGKFNNLYENDALYVFNDIDQKRFIAGASLYSTLSKHLLLSFNYRFENKLKYKTVNTYFNQHSITGGFTWNF